MKIPPVTAFLFLAFSSYVHAQAVPFNYTGNNAEYGENTLGAWAPFSAPVGVPTVGGMTGEVGPNGYAQQFTLTEPTDIASIDSAVTVFPQNLDEFPISPGSTTFTYSLYSQSTFEANGQPNIKPAPLSTSEIFKSQSITIADNNNKLRHMQVK